MSNENDKHKRASYSDSQYETLPSVDDQIFVQPPAYGIPEVADNSTVTTSIAQTIPDKRRKSSRLIGHSSKWNDNQPNDGTQEQISDAESPMDIYLTESGSEYLPSGGDSDDSVTISERNINSHSNRRKRTIKKVNSSSAVRKKKGECK